MALETERKYLDADFDKLRARLKEIGAKYEGVRFETNILYSNINPACQRNLSVVRMRIIEEREKTYNVFTLKNKSHVEEVSGVSCKIREELETEIGDAEIFNQILERMGYQKSLTYEKLREGWKFSFLDDGVVENVQIDLDKLAFCRCLEIEGTCGGIERAAFLLDLDDSQISVAGYPRLYEKLAAEGKLDETAGLMFSSSERAQIRKAAGLE